MIRVISGTLTTHTSRSFVSRHSLMDADRFETLLRRLSTTPTRRGALRLLSSTALTGLLSLGTLSADAKKGGKGKKGKGNKHGHEKVTICHKGQTMDVPPPAVKGHLGHGDSLGPCSATPPPPGPTCVDRVKNGSETDVDCGGSCQRCANDLKCVSQDDCASALCVSGACKACVADADCGIDAAGACHCNIHDIATQPRVCTSQTPAPAFDNCDKCPDDTFCVRTDLGEYTCYQPCGAV